MWAHAIKGLRSGAAPQRKRSAKSKRGSTRRRPAKAASESGAAKHARHVDDATGLSKPASQASGSTPSYLLPTRSSQSKHRVLSPGSPTSALSPARTSRGGHRTRSTDDPQHPAAFVKRGHRRTRSTPGAQLVAEQQQQQQQQEQVEKLKQGRGSPKNQHVRAAATGRVCTRCHLAASTKRCVQCKVNFCGECFDQRHHHDPKVRGHMAKRIVLHSATKRVADRAHDAGGVNGVGHAGSSNHAHGKEHKQEEEQKEEEEKEKEEKKHRKGAADEDEFDLEESQSVSTQPMMSASELLASPEWEEVQARARRIQQLVVNMNASQAEEFYGSLGVSSLEEFFRKSNIPIVGPLREAARADYKTQHAPKKSVHSNRRIRPVGSQPHKKVRSRLQFRSHLAGSMPELAEMERFRKLEAAGLIDDLDNGTGSSGGDHSDAQNDNINIASVSRVRRTPNGTRGASSSHAPAFSLKGKGRKGRGSLMVMARAKHAFYAAPGMSSPPPVQDVVPKPQRVLSDDGAVNYAAEPVQRRVSELAQSYSKHPNAKAANVGRALEDMRAEIKQMRAAQRSRSSDSSSSDLTRAAEDTNGTTHSRSGSGNGGGAQLAKSTQEEAILRRFEASTRGFFSNRASERAKRVKAMIWLNIGRNRDLRDRLTSKSAPTTPAADADSSSAHSSPVHSATSPDSATVQALPTASASSSTSATASKPKKKTSSASPSKRTKKKSSKAPNSKQLEEQRKLMDQLRHQLFELRWTLTPRSKRRAKVRLHGKKKSKKSSRKTGTVSSATPSGPGSSAQPTHSPAASKTEPNSGASVSRSKASVAKRTQPDVPSSRAGKAGRNANRGLTTSSISSTGGKKTRSSVAAGDTPAAQAVAANVQGVSGTSTSKPMRTGDAGAGSSSSVSAAPRAGHDTTASRRTRSTNGSGAASGTLKARRTVGAGTGSSRTGKSPAPSSGPVRKSRSKTRIRRPRSAATSAAKQGKVLATVSSSTLQGVATSARGRRSAELATAERESLLAALPEDDTDSAQASKTQSGDDHIAASASVDSLVSQSSAVSSAASVSSSGSTIGAPAGSSKTTSTKGKGAGRSPSPKVKKKKGKSPLRSKKRSGSGTRKASSGTSSSVRTRARPSTAAPRPVALRAGSRRAKMELARLQGMMKKGGPLAATSASASSSSSSLMLTAASVSQLSRVARKRTPTRKTITASSRTSSKPKKAPSPAGSRGNTPTGGRKRPSRTRIPKPPLSRGSTPPPTKHKATRGIRSNTPTKRRSGSATRTKKPKRSSSSSSVSRRRARPASASKLAPSTPTPKHTPGKTKAGPTTTKASEPAQDKSKASPPDNSTTDVLTQNTAARGTSVAALLGRLTSPVTSEPVSPNESLASVAVDEPSELPRGSASNSNTATPRSHGYSPRPSTSDSPEWVREAWPSNGTKSTKTPQEPVSPARLVGGGVALPASMARLVADFAPPTGVVLPPTAQEPQEPVDATAAAPASVATTPLATATGKTKRASSASKKRSTKATVKKKKKKKSASTTSSPAVRRSRRLARASTPQPVSVARKVSKRSSSTGAKKSKRARTPTLKKKKKSRRGAAASTASTPMSANSDRDTPSSAARSPDVEPDNAARPVVALRLDASRLARIRNRVARTRELSTTLRGAATAVPKGGW